MKVERSRKLIVGILRHGKGIEVSEQLYQEMGIVGASVTSGRGRGAAHKGAFGLWDEVDMISVVVQVDEAEEIFRFIYEAGEVDQRQGGIVFQYPVPLTTRFILPEGLPAEDPNL